MKQETIVNFLKGQTKLLEEGNFDELYYRYQREVDLLSTPLTELLMDAGIEPLDYLTHIPKHYLQYNESITEVVIPENIKRIDDSAFENCGSLTSITIPNSVTSIGSYAFMRCVNLTSVTIPDSVTSIGIGAFSGCSSLTSVTIPNSVTSIGSAAFTYCISLTSVTIGDSVTTIENYAFSGCHSLTSVTIGNGVTTIGSFVFENCSNLTNITIPDSVISIGRYAFNNPVDIKYGGTKEEWYKIRKQMYWNGDVKKYTIHCSDGDVYESAYDHIWGYNEAVGGNR